MESTTIKSFKLPNLDTIVNNLNSYIDNNKETTVDWRKWTIGEDGYLTFEK